MLVGVGEGDGVDVSVGVLVDVGQGVSVGVALGEGVVLGNVGETVPGPVCTGALLVLGFAGVLLLLGTLVETEVDCGTGVTGTGAHAAALIPAAIPSTMMITSISHLLRFLLRM